MAPQVLVTGATGTVGGAVVSQLPAGACRVRALTRNPGTAVLPSHVEVVRGDLSDPDSLDRCLDGVDAVFLVWAIPLTTAPAVVGRIARHARRVVLVSAPHKTPHPFFQQPNAMRALFVELERLIEQSGIDWTFLRPGMFAANALAWWGPQIQGGDVVRWPYAEAPTAPIDERDIAAVAIRALLEPGHARAEYVLTGPESLTQSEQVTTIGDAIGRRLRYEELSRNQAERELHLPAMLLDAWQAALGQPAYVTTTVRDITGTDARTFRRWAVDNAAAFLS